MAIFFSGIARILKSRTPLPGIRAGQHFPYLLAHKNAHLSLDVVTIRLLHAAGCYPWRPGEAPGIMAAKLRCLSFNFRFPRRPATPCLGDFIQASTICVAAIASETRVSPSSPPLHGNTHVCVCLLRRQVVCIFSSSLPLTNAMWISAANKLRRIFLPRSDNTHGRRDAAATPRVFRRSQ